MADLHSSPVCDWLEGSVGHSISAVEAYVGQCVAVLQCVCVKCSRVLWQSSSSLSFSELAKRAEGEEEKKRTVGVDCEASSIQSEH